MKYRFFNHFMDEDIKAQRGGLAMIIQTCGRSLIHTQACRSQSLVFAHCAILLYQDKLCDDVLTDCSKIFGA